MKERNRKNIYRIKFEYNRVSFRYRGITFFSTKKEFLSKTIEEILKITDKKIMEIFNKHRKMLAKKIK